MIREHIQYFPALVLFLLFLSTTIYAQDIKEVQGDEWIKLSSPAEKVTIYEKKPFVKCLITIPFSKENLLVVLDDTDVTNVLDVSKDGFEFIPIQILSPGGHKVSITLTTPDKKEYKKEFSFNVRHTRVFEEMSSTNDVSFLYEGRIKRHVEGTEETTPNSKIEGNITSNSKIKEKSFEGSLNANIRYLEQSLPVDPPTFKKFTIPNYLLTLKYGAEKAHVLGEMGDVQVNETSNTVIGLSRRGVRFNVDSANYRFTYFDVNALT